MDQDHAASQQANTGTLRGLPPRFWALTLLTGIAAGVAAIAMMAILHAVQHVAFGYHSGEYSTAVAHHSDLRRLLVLLIGGLVAGAGLWTMRRFLGGTGGQPTAVVWSGRGRLSLPLTALSGALSEIVIALGASIGRENAPQHLGAAFGDWASRRRALSADQRLLLIACGAGAGVGAVYNVPFAGAVFAAELYLGSITLRAIVPAFVTAGIATAVSWIVLPIRPVYHLPQLGYPSGSLLVFSLLAGPLIGLAAAAWVKLVAWANRRRPHGRALLVQPPLAFCALGLIAFQYPLLLGNGRDLAQFAFTGGGALLTLLALGLLKPVVTALCLRSGAQGGLLTPTMSTGAVLGAFLGHAWALLWPGTPAASYAIVGSAAMLAAGMRTPVAALAFTIELTNSVNPVILAMLVALAGAMLTARLIERRSIYSARLPATLVPQDATPQTKPTAGGRT
ncbi:MAG: chloride channel protein [Acetobacteraceae bacterium]|nr:chloride channel protein [Acetobacteraceae bacterium]